MRTLSAETTECCHRYGGPNRRLHTTDDPVIARSIPQASDEAVHLEDCGIVEYAPSAQDRKCDLQ